MAQHHKPTQASDEQLAADPRVGFTSTGRAHPLQCAICVSFHKPKEPWFAWGMGLPEVMRLPDLAREISTKYPKVAEKIGAALSVGIVPIKNLMDNFGENKYQKESFGVARFANLEDQYLQPWYSMKCTLEALRRRDLKQPPNDGDQRWLESRRSTKSRASIEAEIANEEGTFHVQFFLAFRLILGALGECRFHPGGRMPLAHVPEYPELMHEAEHWCSSGQVRADHATIVTGAAPDPYRPHRPLGNSILGTANDEATSGAGAAQTADG